MYIAMESIAFIVVKCINVFLVNVLRGHFCQSQISAIDPANTKYRIVTNLMF